MVLAILGLALGLRLAYVGSLAPDGGFGSVDARGYRQLAVNLLEQGSFAPQGRPPSLLSAIRTPLYPVFLAIVLACAGNAGHALPLAQAILDVGTVVLVYCLGCRLADRRRGRIAALLYTINPVSFLFVGEALAEVLLTFLLALTFFLFVTALRSQRGRHFMVILTGLASGLVILCKPQLLLLPIILILGMVVSRRPSRQAVKESCLLFATTLLVLLPWLVRNRLAFGEWFLSKAFESNLAHISAVATIAQVQGEEVAPWTPRWEELYMAHVVVPASIRYGWEETTDPLVPQEALRRRHEMASVALDLIRRHPLAFLVSHGKGGIRSLAPSLHRYWYVYFAGQPWPQTESLSDVLTRAGRRIGAGDWAGCADLLGVWWRGQPQLAKQLWLASIGIHLLAYGLVAAGLWSLRRWPAVLLTLGMTLLCLLLMPGPIAYVRFWMPGVPLACAVMSCAFWRRGPGMTEGMA